MQEVKDTRTQELWDRAQELQEVIHHEIPLSRQIGLTAHSYDGVALALSAPLEPNVNHKSTAFAGSLTAAATLAGWGLTWLVLSEHGLRGTIVIQESATRYQLPVGHDFVATCRLPPARAIERFLTGLRRRGKARLSLSVEIQDTRDSEGRVAVVFTGSYVAFIGERSGESRPAERTDLSSRE